MSLTPKRTQYPVNLSNIKYRTRMETLNLTRQWDTFERIENYNDIVYQKLQVGDRSTTYWQFVDASEQKDYTAGQMLHINFYSSSYAPQKLPASAFASISNRVMPNVKVVTPAPSFSMSAPSCIPQTSAMSASAYTEQQSDISIYANVSTYNSAHAYSYIFPSNEEFMSYNRGKDAVCFATNQLEFVSTLKHGLLG